MGSQRPRTWATVSSATPRLSGRQQVDLADLLEIEADGVLTTRSRAGLQGLGSRGVLGFLSEGDGRLGLFGAGDRARSGSRDPGIDFASTFPECHPVTASLFGFNSYDAKIREGVSGTTLKIPRVFPSDGSHACV